MEDGGPIVRIEKSKDFASKAVKASFSRYDSIGKKGKPQKGREWTLLASILKTERPEGEPEVVCLATGSKCIGKSQRTTDGGKINDSHAEILARRLLLQYFYDQLKKAAANDNSIFTCNSTNRRFNLKPGIRFHLFTSHTPCGDASIFPKIVEDDKRFSEDVSLRKEPDSPELASLSKGKNTFCSQEKSKALNSEEVSVKRNSQEAFQESEVICCKRSKKREDFLVLKDDRTIRNGREIAVDDAAKDDSSGMILKSEVDACKLCDSSVVESGITMENKALPRGCSDLNSCAIVKTEKVSSTSKTSINTPMPDIYRTGAKCVPSGRQDQHLKGVDYHVIGTLRTKPGRGERTLSMSCSDKIMKWCILGLQGGLLSTILESPIYLSSIIIGKCPFSEDALLRALSLRGRDVACTSSKYNHRLPEVYYYDDEEFVDSKHKVESSLDKQKYDGKVSASGAAILYCKDPFIHEVVVNGAKQGTTKKHNSTINAQCAVSKSALFKEYKSILNYFETPMDTKKINKKNKNYQESKHSDPDYENARKMFFKAFPDWIEKPTEQELFD